MKEKFEKAIKELKLKEEDIKEISYVNMEKICKIVNCDMLDLMEYLRYER